MKKALIIGGIIVVVAVVAVLVLLGNINKIVKKGVETTGPIILKVPVTLDSVDISFFSGSGELKGLTVGNPEGYKTDYAFRMDQLKVKLDVGSVTSDKIHINEIVIDSPNIIYEGSIGKSNINRILENVKAFTGDGEEGEEGGEDEKHEPTTESQGKKLQIDYFIIQNASISVSTGILQGKKLTIPLPTLKLKDIGKERDADISDVIERVLKAINEAVIPAVQKEVFNIEEGLKGTGGTVKEKVKQGVDKIKGLFSK